jgi:hypothetical protein
LAQLEERLQERLRSFERQTASSLGSSLASSPDFALRETSHAREAAKLQLPAALSLSNDQNTPDVSTEYSTIAIDFSCPPLSPRLHAICAAAAPHVETAAH